MGQLSATKFASCISWKTDTICSSTTGILPPAWTICPTTWLHQCCISGQDLDGIEVCSMPTFRPISYLHTGIQAC
jgi:hypothetical protein